MTKHTQHLTPADAYCEITDEEGDTAWIYMIHTDSTGARGVALHGDERSFFALHERGVGHDDFSNVVALGKANGSQQADDLFAAWCEKERAAAKGKEAITFSEVASTGGVAGGSTGEFVANLRLQGTSDTIEGVRQLVESAPELLEELQIAVMRVELANKEGNPILSAWLQGARAAIAKATRR